MAVRDRSDTATPPEVAVLSSASPEASTRLSGVLVLRSHSDKTQGGRSMHQGEGSCPLPTPQ